MVVELVVDDLTVVGVPGFVQAVGFLFVEVGHLAAVPRELRRKKSPCFSSAVALSMP